MGGVEMNIEEIKKIALDEIEQERLRDAIEQYKTKLRNKRSFLDKLFPFRIVIIKKEV
jgi:hypothetical protein